LVLETACKKLVMAAVAAVTAEFGLALETACQRLVDAAGMEVAAAAAVPGFGLSVVAAVAGVAVVAAAAAAASVGLHRALPSHRCAVPVLSIHHEGSHHRRSPIVALRNAQHPCKPSHRIARGVCFRPGYEFQIYSRLTRRDRRQLKWLDAMNGVVRAFLFVSRKQTRHRGKKRQSGEQLENKKVSTLSFGVLS